MKNKFLFRTIYTWAVRKSDSELKCKIKAYTEWLTKCHTIDSTHNTFLLLQKHLTSGTGLILIGWIIVSNDEHVQCDHRFDSQPLANEPLHSSQLFDTSLQKARNTTFTFWSTVNRPLSAILQTGDIYRIFHELQHSLARLQHRYCDVTILMGW